MEMKRPSLSIRNFLGLVPCTEADSHHKKDLALHRQVRKARLQDDVNKNLECIHSHQLLRAAIAIPQLYYLKSRPQDPATLSQTRGLG